MQIIKVETRAGTAKLTIPVTPVRFLPPKYKLLCVREYDKEYSLAEDIPAMKPRRTTIITAAVPILPRCAGVRTPKAARMITATTAHRIWVYESID